MYSERNSLHQKAGQEVMDLKEINGIDPWCHWYYQSKCLTILRDVQSLISEDLRVLEVGAGDGYFAKSLLKAFGGTAICIDTGYEHDFSEGSILFSKCQQIKSPNVFIH